MITILQFVSPTNKLQLKCNKFALKLQKFSSNTAGVNGLLNGLETPVQPHSTGNVKKKQCVCMCVAEPPLYEVCDFTMIILLLPRFLVKFLMIENYILMIVVIEGQGKPMQIIFPFLCL